MKLNDEQRDLVVANMGMAVVIANQIRSTMVPFDERLSAAYLGLCIAVLDYRPELGPLSTHLNLGMRWAITRLFRPLKRRPAYQYPITDFDVEDDSSADMIDRRLDAEVYARASRKLAPRERQVMTGYSQGLKASEIAECLGITPCAVELARQRAAKKLAGDENYFRE